MGEEQIERKNILAMEFLRTMHEMRYLRKDTLLVGITGREFAFLKTIEEFRWKHPDVPGIYVNDLAAKMYVTKSGASKMLRQLEQHGLIERITDPKDRRNTFVRLTPEGEALGQRQLEYLEVYLTRVAQMMGEARFHEILAGIHELNMAMGDALTMMEEKNSTAEEAT